MIRTFRKAENLVINPVAPNTIQSEIDVSDVDGKISDVTIGIDISHSFTRDLKITVVAPDGQRVLLVSGEGGSGDDFSFTTFDDRADLSVRQGDAPFAGDYRPEESLDVFNGVKPNGKWTLEVADQAFLDGGKLNSWSVSMHSTPRSNYNIDVQFKGGLTASQKDVFALAANRWSEIIIGELPDVDTPQGRIDDLVIEAKGKNIDGPGGILGQAGPTLFRLPSLLPCRGIMEFDSADLARMEADGSLKDVIIHEMGHVIGIGTIWQRMGLVQDLDTNNPIFTGRTAMRLFARLKRESGVIPVPVANTGGPGTFGGHWRESVFGNELLTGFLDTGVNPISRMSIGALKDMGYEVNMDAADRYRLPSSQALAAMGISAEGQQSCRCRTTAPPCEGIQCE